MMGTLVVVVNAETTQRFGSTKATTNSEDSTSRNLLGKQRIMASTTLALGMKRETKSVLR
jgi:hypothetical protein